MDYAVPRSEQGWLYGADFRTIDTITDIKPDLRRVRRKRWVRKIAYVGISNQVKDSATSVGDERSHTTGGAGGGDDVFESYSDDDKDDDDDDKSTLFSNTFGGVFGKERDAGGDFPIRVVHDPALTAIGKEMRQIETDCKKDDEVEFKDWQKTVAPSYKIQVRLYVCMYVCGTSYKIQVRRLLCNE